MTVKRDPLPSLTFNSDIASMQFDHHFDEMETNTRTGNTGNVTASVISLK